MNGFKMVVDGFGFSDQATAQKACKEVDGIQYIKGRLDMRNPRMVLEMYHKLLAERVFETPVGLLYLKELQTYLLAAPELEKESIEAIPVPGAEFQDTGEEKNVHTGDDNKGTQQAAARRQETLEWYVEKLEESRQKERLAEYRRSRAEERTKESRKRLRLSWLISLFFALVAVGVGLVTLTDQHPNILNYENKLIEKYQDWEDDLQNREDALKEKELADSP